jgi:hypothetical protein
METDYLERRLFINTLFKLFGNCGALMVLGQFSDSNLAVVLAFLTLQDKHNMPILSVIIKSIRALCETGQTISPKAPFLLVSKARNNKFVFSDYAGIHYINPYNICSINSLFIVITQQRL